ncbi:MAG: response regulator transcription factor [Beijerinckiaceae bacterium]|jgi:two-component system phosphate regulon response regulator OmpR
MTKSSAQPLADDAPHVLVVDDDRRLRELLARFLGDHGYRISVARDTTDARAALSVMQFDGVILDVMMPGENGFDFAKSLRTTSDVPILMLTARSETDDRVRGLEIGVDDYLSKPFEPRELLLRLNNIRRRTTQTATVVETVEQVSFGPFVYHIGRGELRSDGEPVKISERERDILTLLATRPGQTVPREEFAAHEDISNERTVDVQINRLRRKIEADPANPTHLQTVRGVGYRLVAT